MGWYQFDCTRHVRDFLGWARDYSGRSQTYGFALAATDSSASSKHFCSGEYTGSTKPSIIINYTESSYDTEEIYNSSGSYPFKAFGKMINGVSPLIKFRVATTGTYVIETLSSTGFGAAAQTTDTMLELFDSNHNRIAFNNDNALASTTYSRISASLSSGVYYVLVSDAGDSDGAAGTSDSIGLTDNVKCYVIIEGFDTGESTGVQGNGELVGAYSTYANQIYEFYKTQDANAGDNCLGFAIGTGGEYPETLYFNPSSTDYIVNRFVSFGYPTMYDVSQKPSTIQNYVVAYSNDGAVSAAHYAKVANGIVEARLGSLEAVVHPYIDAYFGHYGEPVVCFVQ